MLTDFQYRLLRLIAPRAPTHMGEGSRPGQGKLRMLLGADQLAELRGKVVLDFGCGFGNEAVELARAGAARVIGVDVREHVLQKARELAAREGVDTICTFATACREPIDAVISVDAFEHFSDPAHILSLMYATVKPGGLAFVSFGPTWFHPYGGHFFSVFPWAHLLFSEKALIRWRAQFRSDGATRFSEVDGGLNQMTIARFEEIVRASAFKLEAFEAVPIRKVRWLHNRLTREFITSIVRCRLRKP